MECYRYVAEKAKAASISSAASANLPSAVVLNFSTAFLPEAEDTVQTCVKCVTCATHHMTPVVADSFRYSLKTTAMPTLATD